MISCRADLFKQVIGKTHPMDIVFILDPSNQSQWQLQIDAIHFLDQKDAEDPEMDGLLEWVSQIADELFLPIAQARQVSNTECTIPQAENYVKHMQERLSQLPRIKKVEQNVKDEIETSTEADEEGRYYIIHRYTVTMLVKEKNDLM